MAVEPAVRPHRIALNKSSGTRYEEGRASVAILPGMLIERTPGSSGDEVRPHPTAVKGGEVMLALEDALQGRTILQAYAIGDMVPYQLFLPGDVVFALLTDAETADDGDLLTSGGNGLFVVAVATDVVIAEALETLTPSGDAHIRARIIPQRVL